MIKVEKKENHLSREAILNRITEYDIFRYYLGDFKVGKSFCNPLRGENNPSMIIRKTQNGLSFRDYGCNWRGDCFSLVQAIHYCNFPMALAIIDRDFSLGLRERKQKDTCPSPAITWEKPDIRVSRPPFLQASRRGVTQAVRDYLNQYHLEIKDMNFCKDTLCFDVDLWYFNRRRQVTDAVTLGYRLKNSDGEWLKIYRPYHDKKGKWMSAIPFTQMHGVGNITPGSRVGLLSKSLKDGAFVHKYILPGVEILQAEDFAALTPENVKRLKESCDELYISFDNDNKGVMASTEIVEEIGCKYINPPQRLLDEGITDWTDWVKATDVQTVVDYFRTKKVIP